jgi:hypothetical protein
VSLVTTCNRCLDYVRLEEDMLGQRVRCPVCRHVFVAGAATPYEELLRQFQGKKHAGTEPRPWCDRTPVVDSEARSPRDQPSSTARIRGRSANDRPEPGRSVDKVRPLDPYRRPALLFVAAVGLPLGLPLVLMFFVPGGIVSAGSACGLGVPLAMLAMLLASIFILPRWPLRRRVGLSLGTVAFAYFCLLVIILAQWLDFTSGSSSTGKLVQGMKSGGRSSSPVASAAWKLSRLQNADFTLNLPANDAQPVVEHTDFGRRTRYDITDPVTQLVYKVSWTEIDAPLVLLTTDDLGKNELKKQMALNGALVSNDDPGWLGGHAAYGFSLNQANGNTLVERVLRSHQRAYFLSVDGPRDKVMGGAAQQFFDSFKLDKE